MPPLKNRKAKTTSRVILVGNFGAENIGDELILEGFLSELAQHSPQTKVTVLGGNPRLIQRWHGVDALPLLPCGLRSFFAGNWVRSFQAIRAADNVVFPGGGLFTDSESFRAVLLWGMHLLIARFFWKPVYLLGQSIGPFHSEAAKNFTRFCLSKAEWIEVRDTASEKELRKLHIPASKIKAGKDSALGLVKRLPKVKMLKKKGRRKILLSLRNFRKLNPNLFRELGVALEKLSEKPTIRITFAAFGKGDLEALAKVQPLVGKKIKVVALPESAEEILQEMKKFDVVVGMRLHSLISARIAGVPSLGISYSRKVAEFQKSQQQKFIEAKDFSSEKLLKLLNS
ncbi:MAG: polysaccharide pyruvyl transferase family protein [Candidatus Gracilibacteria bacterium]|nr:polysaccharide pyruvyl transferase family protein [Candidatus Gracilibacteria bacterium]MDD5179005.1 polysaccharide pyruvyl transferase family protein [Candidatus Gracilibacteria bacterium]